MIRMLEMQTMRIALQKDTVIKKEILIQEVIDLTNDDDDDDYGAKIWRVATEQSTAMRLIWMKRVWTAE